MKDKKKRLTRLFGVVGLSLCFGLSACNSVDSVDKQEYQYQEKLSRRFIAFDDNTYTITYDSDYYVNPDYWGFVLNDLIEGGYNLDNKISVSSYTMVGMSPYTSQYLYYLQTGQTSYAICLAYSSNAWFQKYNNNGWFYSGSYKNLESITFPSANAGYTILKNAYDEYIDFITPDPMGEQVGYALSDFISILVSPISQFAFGVAGGVSTMATSLFLEVNDGVVTGLSVFGGIMALFCGLALAIHITTRVYLWITSLGKN